MSYWIRIKDAPRRFTDGVDEVEFPDTLEHLFAVTAQAIDEPADGFNDLDLKDGIYILQDLREVLTRMVTLLGTKEYSDLWAPTPGNLGARLARVLELLETHPNEGLEVEHVKTLWTISHEDTNPY